jgi:hypothetical protein
LYCVKEPPLPTAVLLMPVVLNKSAAAPNAAFSSAVLKRSVPSSGIEAALCVAKERMPTNGCVRRAGGEVKKGLLPFCRGEPGIASVRRRDNRPRNLGKALCRQSSSECELSCEVSCLVSFSSLLPPVDPSQCRSEKGEESSGRKASCPDPGFQTTPSVEKISPARQDNLLQARVATSSSTNAVSLSSACTTKRFPSSRCASTIQIVRPPNQELIRSSNSNWLC